MIPALILAIVLFVFLSCEYYTFKTGVPTVASFPSAQKKIVEILKKEMKACPQKRPYQIMDLGSGGGQLCRRIAKEIPDAQVIGLELSILPWLRSVLTQKLKRLPNLTFKRLDFWTYDCAKTDAVIVFLTGAPILERMGQKLRQELKRGTLIIANDEQLGGDWIPMESLNNPIQGIFQSKIYLYRQA